MGNIHTFIWPITSPCFKMSTCLHFPESNGSIVTTISQHVSIRAESNRPDPIGVSAQSFEALVTSAFPQSHCFITATHEGISHGTKSDRPDSVRVSKQDLKGVSSVNIP